ncbi:hypothetical protein JCM11641_004076 [Rhodosporidiobolus odoratus]
MPHPHVLTPTPRSRNQWKQQASADLEEDPPDNFSSEATFPANDIEQMAAGLYVANRGVEARLRNRIKDGHVLEKISQICTSRGHSLGAVLAMAVPDADRVETEIRKRKDSYSPPRSSTRSSSASSAFLGRSHTNSSALSIPYKPLHLRVVIYAFCHGKGRLPFDRDFTFPLTDDPRAAPDEVKLVFHRAEAIHLAGTLHHSVKPPLRTMPLLEISGTVYRRGSKEHIAWKVFAEDYAWQNGRLEPAQFNSSRIVHLPDALEVVGHLLTRYENRAPCQPRARALPDVHWEIDKSRVARWKKELEELRASISQELRAAQPHVPLCDPFPGAQPLHFVGQSAWAYVGETRDHDPSKQYCLFEVVASSPQLIELKVLHYEAQDNCFASMAGLPIYTNTPLHDDHIEFRILGTVQGASSDDSVFVTPYDFVHTAVNRRLHHGAPANTDPWDLDARQLKLIRDPLPGLIGLVPQLPKVTSDNVKSFLRGKRLEATQKRAKALARRTTGRPYESTDAGRNFTNQINGLLDAPHQAENHEGQRLSSPRWKQFIQRRS